MGRSLHRPNYRRFITGHAISVVGTWMQRVAQDWLVLELTGSAVAIGTATALQFLPMLLFGVWGGVLVDRFDRWKLIVITQSVSLVLAAVLAVTTLLGQTTLGLVYVMAALLGLVTVVDSPARQAFVTDLVPPADYVNAQAINSTIHNAGRLVGPAVAGLRHRRGRGRPRLRRQRALVRGGARRAGPHRPLRPVPDASASPAARDRCARGCATPGATGSCAPRCCWSRWSASSGRTSAWCCRSPRPRSSAATRPPTAT